MKQKLSFKEYIYVASMLFGMFFGAGNLIFPVYMGQVAGRNMWAAVLGFLITGVGLPLLGVAALGISRSNGLFDLSHKVGRPYAFFFTCALYLTIGPFFAIPRCATTSFTVGLEQILPHDDKSWLYLLLFSLLFFAVTLVLSLRPGKILTYVGKVLTPCFLVFLAIMVFVTILHPTTSIGAVEPQGAYAAQPFFTGFLEGYNTMDALASLAFGIVQGFLVAYLDIQPFIVTLAGMFFARGMTTIVNTKPFNVANESFTALKETRVIVPGMGSVNKLGNYVNAYVEIGVIVALLVVILMFIMLRWTKMGRSFYAVGGNNQSALMLGINVKRTKFMSHLLCGLLAGIGGYV